MTHLYKILWKDQSRSHLIWAVLGTMAGFVLLLSGIQFYTNLKGLMSENKDLLDPEYIVINKEVNIARTFGLGTSGFSEKEIAEIASQPFSERVAPFVTNKFPISALTKSSQFQNFYTELFFEAVPDEFIDVKSDEWKWEENQDYIPVILPQDYLNLYNFGFAQSQGLPQIPKELIHMIPFEIKLKGKVEKLNYKGRIVGFSNRINSILVPYEFLTWANKRLGYLENTDPSRIILVSNDPTDPAILQFIEEKGYDTIREKLKSSRLNIIFKLVLSFLVIIAAIIIGLAFLIFLLSLQLMISRSSEKISRLKKLGYHYTEISMPYILVLLILLAILTSFSLIVTRILSGKFAELASEWHLEIAEKPFGIVYLVAAALIIILFTLNSLSILLSTKKIK